MDLDFDKGMILWHMGLDIGSMSFGPTRIVTESCVLLLMIEFPQYLIY